jgi:GNAT superfamily N-acetyltransferase
MATMINTVIRPLRPTDVAPTREVIEAANREFEPIVPSALFEAYLADVLDVESRLGRGETFVAEHRGRIVGTITYFADANDEGAGPRVPARTAGVRTMAVHPDARGLGIARQLVKLVISRAREDGAQAAVLHTWMVMGAAIGLYESLGFRRAPDLDVGSRDFFPTEIDEDPSALAFRLDLAADPA